MERRRWSTQDLALFIEASSDAIMQAWEIRVRSEVAAAREQDTTALRHTLPEFLAGMSAALLADASRTSPAGPSPGTHGIQRARVAGYSLAQVISEYAILRQTLFEILEAESPLPVALRNRLLVLLDATMCEAASAFSEDQRVEERRGRLDAERELDRVKLAAELLRGERAAWLDQMAELTADAGLRESFVATLAHDLRSPLGSIKLALELLLVELPRRPEVTELSSLMLRNLERAEVMLRDLLDTHRIHAGHRLPMAIERCDLVAVARDTLAGLDAEYPGRFVLKAERGVLGFWDAERLRRLLENLLTNAVKYGAVARPVTVRLAQDEQEATLAVHNFGNPIPREDQTSLFEAFYRAKPVESGKARGWGLGLTLVRGVVDGHGGSVAVASTEAEGTTFTVTLPNDSRPFQAAQR